MKNTKILTVLGVMLAMGLTACGGKSNQGGGSGDTTSQHTHSWGDWTEVTPATCTEAGSKERVCECGQKDTQPITALGHDFQDGEAYIQDGVKYLDCSRCHIGMLQWAAKDYDKDASLDLDTSKVASDGSIRFSGNPTAANAAGDGIEEKSYIVYKVNLHKPVEHAGLDFEIQPSSNNVEIFDAQSNDQKPGKDFVDGQVVDATKRYALYVNGDRVEIGKDPGASTAKAWYTWPVDFNLKAGENVIKLVCMGGYRAYMFNFRLTNIPHYEHKGDYSAKISETPAGEGYIATETYACTYNCGKTALRWSALDYDETKTTARSDEGKGPESRDSGKAIRFSDAVQGSNEAHDNKGTHIVYNVKTPAVQNVGLSMYSSARTTDNPIPPAFDKVEGDNSKGYELVNGEYVRPASRYGLKIDGQLYMLYADGQKYNGTTWYEMPVDIPALEAGIHEFEIFNYGGYRVDIYNFQLTGCPAVQGSTFTFGDTWESDDNGHWKTVTGQTDVKFMYAEHKLVEGAVTVDATDSTIATQAYTCSVCGKTVSIKGGVYGTFKWQDALQAGSASLDNDGKVNAGDYNLLVFNVPAAGTYIVSLTMQGSNGNGTKTLDTSGTDHDGQGFAISANGNAGTFLGSGKTYEEFFGANQTTWVSVEFGEVQLVAGKNEIKVTAKNRNYRTKIKKDGNVTVAAKPAAAAQA